MTRTRVAVALAGLVGTAVSAYAQSPAAPTFSKHVAPVLYQNCTNCHRPGEIGPMSLLSFSDARPPYDFNWQTDYVFKQPLNLPKGTKLHTAAWYDNSTANKANPDPKKDVYRGDQTWEEMQFTAFTFSMDNTPAKTASGGAKQ